MKDKIISPCINICKTNPITGFCNGCGRTIEEISLWGKVNTSNEWKKNNLKESTNRLEGLQRKFFEKSYKKKVLKKLLSFKRKNN